jgi:hypothetical protein
VWVVTPLAYGCPVQAIVETFVRDLTHTPQGLGWINTAFIERLNATFRLRLA